MRKIEVSDVTLKVWAEELKRELSFREKLAVANALQKINVNAVELPSLNSKEQGIVNRTIAQEISCTIAIPNDEDGQAIQSICDAKNKRLQVVLPASTVQMEYNYHVKAPKMLEIMANAIKQAKQSCKEVELVCKDATRADDGFVCQVANVAKQNGASIITLCDDAGVFFPEQFASLVKQIKESVDIKVFVQPSDALKMSACIAVESIKAGADGIKTAIDAPEYLSPDVLCQILRVKGGELDAFADLDATVVNKMVATVKDISNASNVNLGQSSNKSTLNFNEECSLKDISDEICALGYELSSNDLGKVYEEFKRVCAKKGSIGEKELEAIVASTAMQVPTTFHLVNYVVNSGNIITATANVTLEKDGEQLCGVSTGDGPIDAAFHAIEQIIGHHYELDDFSVTAVTKGREAVGSAIIRLRANGKLYSGNGVSTDIVGACIRAYVNALNKIVYTEI